jgi:predicted DNA-binding protein
MPNERKPNSSDRLKKTQTAMYMEPEQMDALKALSARTRVPMQVYLREGLEHVLKKYGKGGAK